jgi:hypothetical protein
LLKTKSFETSSLLSDTLLLSGLAGSSLLRSFDRR